MMNIKPNTLEQNMKMQYEDWKTDLIETEEKYEAAKEKFEEFLEEMENDSDMDELMDIYNTFASECNKPLIHDNWDEVLNEFIQSPSDALEQVENYSYYDNYVSFWPLISYTEIPFRDNLKEIFDCVLRQPDLFDLDIRAITEEDD